MIEKRFYIAESNLIDGYCVFDKKKKYAFSPRPRKADCLNDTHILNELYEENQKMKQKGLKVLEFYINKLRNTNNDIQSVRDEIWIVKQVLYEMGVLDE